MQLFTRQWWRFQLSEIFSIGTKIDSSWYLFVASVCLPPSPPFERRLKRKRYYVSFWVVYYSRLWIFHFLFFLDTSLLLAKNCKVKAYYRHKPPFWGGKASFIVHHLLLHIASLLKGWRKTLYLVANGNRLTWYLIPDHHVIKWKYDYKWRKKDGGVTSFYNVKLLVIA